MIFGVGRVGGRGKRLRRGGGVAGWEDVWEDGSIGGGWEVGRLGGMGSMRRMDARMGGWADGRMAVRMG